MSNDSAHLAAMGFPDPQIPTPEPEPLTIADRAQALQIPRLAVTNQQYAATRTTLGYGTIDVDLAFRGQRRRHKVAQYLQNDVSRDYFRSLHKYAAQQVPQA